MILPLKGPKYANKCVFSSKISLKYTFCTFGAFRGQENFFFKNCILLFNHISSMDTKCVLEVLYLIETLKMANIYTLHPPPQKKKG